MTPPSGLLLFDKPQGWTSHDAVDALRRMLPRGTKVGHSGTLDPLATGLLVMLVGPCTKLQQRFQGLDKVYSGTIRLGLSTDTGDVTGTATARGEVPPLSLADLQQLMSAHCGTLEMPAPAYSAVKHQGQALYKYARKGLPVPEKLRRTTVFSWEALAYQAPDLSHRLACSSGTYVRSLAESLGRRLGCGATVASLRRDRIEGFSVGEALTLEGLKGLSSQGLRERIEASLQGLLAASA